MDGDGQWIRIHSAWDKTAPSTDRLISTVCEFATVMGIHRVQLDGGGFRFIAPTGKEIEMSTLGVMHEVQVSSGKAIEI